MARACIDDNESHVVSFALIYTLASKDAFCTMEWMELKDLAKSPVTWWVARALISCCATMSKFSICFVPFKVAYGLCSPVQLLPEIVDLGESLARGAQGGRLDVVQLQKKKIIFFFFDFSWTDNFVAYVVQSKQSEPASSALLQRQMRHVRQTDERLGQKHT